MTDYSPARLNGVPLGEMPLNQLYLLSKDVVNGHGPDSPFLRADELVVNLDPEILPPELARVLRNLRKEVAGLELVTIPFGPGPLTMSVAFSHDAVGKHAHLKGPVDFEDRDIHPDIHQALPTPVHARMVRPQFRPVEQLPPMVPMVMGSTFRIIQDRHGTRLAEGVPLEPFYGNAVLLGMTHDLVLWEGEPVCISPWHYGSKTFTLHRMGLPRRTLTLPAGTFLNVAHP